MSVKSQLIVRSVEGEMSKGLANDARKLFNEIVKTINVQSSEALMVNGAVMILGNKKVTAQSKIQITNPQILTDHALKVEKELQEVVRKLKKELDLTQGQTDILVKNYNSEKKQLKNKEMELHNKIELMEKMAEEIKEKSVEEKLLDSLLSNHDQLYKVLDKIEINKVHFSEEVKKEIVGINENI